MDERGHACILMHVRLLCTHGMAFVHVYILMHARTHACAREALGMVTIVSIRHGDYRHLLVGSGWIEAESRITEDSVKHMI
jgi:hypothetical protein